MSVLEIESVEVGERRVEALVRVPDPALGRTSAAPGIAERAVELLPGLRRHTCENDADRNALREFANTETPHLLEHVAVELMALSGAPRSLRGETAWDFARDGAGMFRVRLEYEHDLVAIGALREAAAIVEWLFLAEGVAPDVEAAATRLRALR